MEMQMALFNNIWHVNTQPVDNIILFSARQGKELLDTKAQWLSPPRTSNAANFVAEIDTVVDRRKVGLTRAEHFMLSAKGKHILYLNADQFDAKGTVELADPDWHFWYTDYRGQHQHYGMTIYLTLSAEEGAKPEAIFVRRQAEDAVRTLISEEGRRLTAITDLINSKLHSRSQLSEYQVNDILPLLPQINAIHSGK